MSLPIAIIKGKELHLALVTIAMLIIYALIRLSKSGRIKAAIRSIAALDAIKEMVGRAAEMSRPIFCMDGHGLGGADTDRGPQHAAAAQIFGHVAFEAGKVKVSVNAFFAWPEFIPLATDLMKEAYLASGSPETFSADMVRFTSGQSWGHAITVMEEIVRRNPAGSLLVGAWSGEALLVAEAAAMGDAITIGGTEGAGQAASFVAVCDYNMFGGELYAAAATSSNDEVSLGSILGQDIIIGAGLTFLVAGAVFVALTGIRVG